MERPAPDEVPLEAHARAREEDDSAWVNEPWATEVFAHEVRQTDERGFGRAARALRRAANRTGWEHFSAYRAAKLSRALRACERVLGERFAGREKTNRRWQVRARVGKEVVVVVELALAPLRKMADFKLPLEIVVLHPDVIDVAALQRELGKKQRSRATAPVLDTKLPVCRPT